MRGRKAIPCWKNLTPEYFLRALSKRQRKGPHSVIKSLSRHGAFRPWTDSVDCYNAEVKLTPLRLLITFSILMASGVLADEESQSGKANVSKKGFGLAERKGMDAHNLELLKVGWYYNWGPQTKLTNHPQFVPMIFSLKTGAPKGGSHEFILGYNEPDNTKQSDISVKDALKNWSMVSSNGKTVISPAMAGNPIAKDWLQDFIKEKPKVDCIAVHWYKGVEAGKFIKDLEEIHTHFKKPLWITEFAPQTAASAEAEPGKFTQAQVSAFITATTEFMDKTPWVQRYAWHDSHVGTSALFNQKGELTESGKAYAAAGK